LQEINDLAVNAPGTLAASACNDKVIRVWSLQVSKHTCPLVTAFFMGDSLMKVQLCS
jgi:hypothetical protein